jgi:hypothetical protein
MASPEIPDSDKVTKEGAKDVADGVKGKAKENTVGEVADPATDPATDPAPASPTPMDQPPITIATTTQPIKKIIERLKSKSPSPTPKDVPSASEAKPANEPAEDPAEKTGLLKKICSILPSGNYSACPRCNADGTLGDCKVCGWNGGFGGNS